MLRKLLFITLCCVQVLAMAQPKVLDAVKATAAPLIDGKLDDPAWEAAPVASDFIQNYPLYGASASQRTTVRILYDNEAIYVGAAMQDDPGLIRKQLTPRDGEQKQDVDYFSVFFDTYNDQQNGFQFLVTSANVQSDIKLGTVSLNAGEFGDRTWDAVWQSQVQLTENGWTVEMRIPYLSLRFAKKEVQTWGLQFLRFVKRSNELDFWNPVDPNVNGFANQFGKYADLKNIQPPLRLSFSPYLTGGVRINPKGSDPKTQFLRNGGMDVKYGVNESFTLDATLIPDFGQVVSDNIVNNLSPFEVRFQENRPFFTEGTELFNKSGLFYSRRIGDIPSGYYAAQAFANAHPNYELLKNPSVTQLYNGIKFSGRTRRKLGIGIFNAVTAPMHAKFLNTSSKQDTLIQTEPLTNYNIIVLDQALKGRSSITFTNTNVMRKGTARDANVSSLDWSLFTKNNRYQLKGTARYSRIFGYTPYDLYGGAINLVYDTVSRGGRLYVKPYSGFNTTVQLGKVSGPWQYYISNNITSHTFDPNDLGYLQSADKVNYAGGISFNQFRPTENFITYRYALDLTTQYLYKPYRFSELYVSASASWVFRNFWDLTLSVNSYPVTQHDFFELRTPGMSLQKPAEVTFNIDGNTDNRRRLFFNYSLGYAARAVSDNSYNRLQFFLRYRFSNKFTLSASFFRQYEDNQRGYAFIREVNNAPIVGYRNFTETISVLSGIYSFAPRLNLTLRARHYWQQVNYNNFFNVAADGSLIAKDPSFHPLLDDNFNTFNLDAFLTWDFRLGSRVIFGWKNWLGDSFAVPGDVYGNYIRNLGKTFGVPHGNELTLKLIYFLDYNQLRRK